MNSIMAGIGAAALLVVGLSVQTYRLENARESAAVAEDRLEAAQSAMETSRDNNERLQKELLLANSEIARLADACRQEHDDRDDAALTVLHKDPKPPPAGYSAEELNQWFDQRLSSRY